MSKNEKIGIVIMAAFVILLPISTIFMTVTAASSAVSDTLDNIKSTIAGWFSDDKDDKYDGWYSNVYEEYYVGITSDEYPQLNLALALSAYHYADTGSSFVTDSYSFDDYMNNFKDNSTASEVLKNVSDQTGYEISDDVAEKIYDLQNSMNSITGGTTELVDGDASKVTPSGTTDGSSFDGGSNTDRYKKAVQAFVSAYGHACYDGRGYLQCVSVSEWYLTAVYHAHYASGNGRDIVGNALARDPDKLIALSDWTAGAIFSVQGFDGYGHTGYVAKVDKAAGKVWLTEAWGSNGTYHENREWSLSAFYSYYGTNVSFCIGKDYYQQLQNQSGTASS